MRCSIIIRTLNEERYLPQLLAALEEQSLPAEQRETIIVDSGSTDHTLDIAASYNAHVIHIRRDEFSFGRSLNLGCQAAKGEIFVLISGHCVPATPTWLEHLISPFEDPEVGIVYGRQMAGKETLFSEARIFAKYFPDSPTPSQNSFFCNNANAALRHSIWERHRYDDDLTGLEDLHLAKRAVSEKWRIGYSRDAAVHHYHHESWRQIKRRFERESLALRSIMPEVHLTLFDVIRYSFAAVFTDWKYAFRDQCLLKNVVPIVCYRFCQYFGSWSGNRIHRKLSHEEKERYFYPS